MRLVIIESPYAGDVEANLAYGRRCLRDSLDRGEAPFASHLLYTQPRVLNDLDQSERVLGITAGLHWGMKAQATAAYMDRRLTPGMALGIAVAEFVGRPVEYRWLQWTAWTAKHVTSQERDLIASFKPRAQELAGPLLYG